MSTGTPGGVRHISILWASAIQHARKCDGFADMLQSAHPGYEALHSHAEAGVGDAAVAAQIEIPVERFFRQMMLVETLLQQFQTNGCAGRRR